MDGRKQQQRRRRRRQQFFSRKVELIKDLTHKESEKGLNLPTPRHASLLPSHGTAHQDPSLRGFSLSQKSFVIRRAISERSTRAKKQVGGGGCFKKQVGVLTNSQSPVCTDCARSPHVRSVGQQRMVPHNSLNNSPNGKENSCRTVVVPFRLTGVFRDSSTGVPNLRRHRSHSSLFF